MAEKEIILNVKVQTNTEAAIKQIMELNTQIEREKNLQKEYNQWLKEGTVSWEEYNREMELSKQHVTEYSTKIRALRKEIQNNIKVESDLRGSLVQLRAALSNLTAEYDNLSKAERDSAKGKELQEKINAVTKELKGAEEATGRFNRNVGNYENAIKNVFGNNQLVAGIQAVRNGVIGVSKAFDLLKSHPVIAVISVITALFLKLANSAKNNEEQYVKLQQVLAPLKMAMDGITRVVESIVDVFLSAAQAVTGLVGAFLDFIGVGDSINQNSKDYIELEKQKLDLANKERSDLVENAKLSMEASDLRAKSAQKDKYSAEERIQFLNEAIDKEKAMADNELEQAKQRLEIAKKEAERTKNSKEVNDELAQAEANLYNVQKEYNTKTRELYSQRSEAQTKLNQEEEQRLQLVQERSDKELAAMRALRDSENALIKDSFEKQKADINASYDDQIADLKKRMETEENLTTEAKAAMSATIANLEKQRDAELAEVNEESIREKLEQEAAYIEQRLQLATEGTIQEYSLKAEQLKKEKEIELSNTKLTAEQKQLIEDSYQKKLDEMTSEYERKKQEKAMEALELELSNRLAAAKIAGEDELQVELENAKKRLDSLQQLEGESDAEFKARQLEAQQEYLDAKEELAQREIEIEQAKFEAASQITGALSGLFEQLGEDNKAFMILSKTLALAEVAINTGKAISSAVAASATKGIFGIAEAVSLIATIITNMTTAIGIINSAKFADGGLVEGPGTGTSDSIPAMLSNGESVMTARATSMFAPLLSAINVAGGGVPIQVREKSSQALGEEMIARAIARGMQDVHPIVSVTEINKVGSQVKVVENLGSI
jgi:flagellar biosynthesis GTPase FlhF